MVYDGKTPTAEPDARTAKIIDPEGNVISRIYNDIYYYFFDEDNYYIGIAHSTGGEWCEVPLNNGMEYPPEGYWFVDKNGTAISERFDYLPLGIENMDEIITIEDDNGNKTEIAVKDYVLKTK